MLFQKRNLKRQRSKTEGFYFCDMRRFRVHSLDSVRKLKISSGFDVSRLFHVYQSDARGGILPEDQHCQNPILLTSTHLSPAPLLVRRCLKFAITE